MQSLEGKVVLVTGAAKRLGAAIARAAHVEGARVAIHYRGSRSQADELCVKLNALRQNSARAFQADLLDTNSHRRLIQETVAVFGRLDVLVNNASTFYPTPIGTITDAHWKDLMGANVKAPLFLSQAAASELKKTQGLILNMADIHGLKPLIKHPVYSIAKAGLVMMTKSLARELGPEIRVNAIAPGPVLWPEGDMNQALKDEIITKTALKRSGSSDDVARAALYFMKDAPFVTGQILGVDGGRSIGW
ncbi:MAG TPA: pteridine reductase [Steroidobacteraceae bacterium]|nr:pteridine reductase [Steroidobacteraceae bacterium]